MDVSFIYALKQAALLTFTFVFDTCAENNLSSSRRENFSTAIADPITSLPKLHALSLTSSCLLPDPLLSTPLATRRALQHSDTSFSSNRNALYHMPQCERLGQRISNSNSFISLAPAAPLAHAAPLPHALEFQPGIAERSRWSMSYGRSHPRECPSYGLEPRRVASLMNRFSSSTRPMHCSGCQFRVREPAESQGAILSGAESVGMSVSNMAQSLMSCRGTCLLGEIAGDLRRELFSSRFARSTLKNSTGFESNNHFQFTAHQSQFNFPNVFDSRNTRLPDRQASRDFSKRELGSPRDSRLMQHADHSILRHHLLVTPSLSANYALDITSVSICSGVVRTAI